MNISPIAPRSTLRTEVGEKLRKAILDRELAPGSKIVESKLATLFGVSRAPLREAISALVEEGLIIHEPFSGYFVQSLTEQSLRDLYGIRRVLECFAFECIWDKRTPAYFYELERRSAVLTAAITSGDRLAAIEAELALHGTVYEYCGNELLLGMWRGLSGRLQLYWSLHQEVHGRKGAKLDGHDDYIAFSKADDINLIRQEVVEHVERGMEQVLQSVRTHNGE
ncbi:GntR family transcriptional regulator [Pokkaliibacter sp. CJK22405]|uniref:GntR family transcriptional regulator n=1 Tax=Pokkaliibacter sp. CJK22405 TaxID=3384615 RepID=UPI003984D4B7